MSARLAAVQKLKAQLISCSYRQTLKVNSFTIAASIATPSQLQILGSVINLPNKVETNLHDLGIDGLDISKNTEDNSDLRIIIWIEDRSDRLGAIGGCNSTFVISS